MSLGAADALDVYFEARKAFVDRPQARIRTEESRTRDCLFVQIRERIGNEVLALSYQVQAEPTPLWVVRKLAIDARLSWGEHLRDAGYS